MRSLDTARAIRDLPEADAIAASVEGVLGDALYWMPVRHHSPTVARFVERALVTRRPRLVFLEAPAGLEHLAPHVVHRDTRPPIALYASFRDDAGAIADREGGPPLQLASWYPLLAYSPEYVAMEIAAKIGAEVVFVDLPHHALAAHHAKRARSEQDAKDQDAKEEEAPQELLTHSELYARLARAAGYRTWDEAWDTLFELGAADRDLETYRRELATFCAAARATTPRERIERDDTRPRERHMWRTIRQTLEVRAVAPRDAMVICGGFHLFLDRDDPEPPPDAPEGTVHHAIVPYSYRRIWERTGYGAGNRAPRFYHAVHEALRRGDAPEEVLAEHGVGILHEARKRGERVASADAIAVVHHTRLLAQLRGRALPVLDDLHDALVTCCVKGDPDVEGATLRKVVLEADVGTRVGRVTDTAGRLPLVRDHYEQLDALELASVLEHERVHHLTLDRREPLDARRAAFLHRLRYLGVPIGDVQRQGDPFGQSIFRERWRIAWSAGIEAALVERSLDGDTVEAAALHALGRALGEAGKDASATCRELVHAVEMDLPHMVVHAESACGDAIDEDGRFVSLADALTSLRVLERYASYRELRRTELRALLERAWDRACFAVPEVAAAPPEEHPAIVGALRSLAEIALSRDDLDASLFATYVQSAAALSTVPELRGAFLGILVEIRKLDVKTLADELAAHARGGEDQQLAAGDFLHGVLAVSTTAVMMGARALVEALDALLRAAGREVFLAMVPRLRAAVEQLHERHRDALAKEVARLHGLAEDALDGQLATSAESAALIAELDAEVARIMKDWVFT